MKLLQGIFHNSRLEGYLNKYLFKTVVIPGAK